MYINYYVSIVKEYTLETLCYTYYTSKQAFYCLFNCFHCNKKTSELAYWHEGRMGVNVCVWKNNITH